MSLLCMSRHARAQGDDGLVPQVRRLLFPGHRRPDRRGRDEREVSDPSLPTHPPTRQDHLATTWPQCSLPHWASLSKLSVFTALCRCCCSKLWKKSCCQSFCDECVVFCGSSCCSCSSNYPSFSNAWLHACKLMHLVMVGRCIGSCSKQLPFCVTRGSARPGTTRSTCRSRTAPTTTRSTRCSSPSCARYGRAATAPTKLYAA